ncbi:hypothetical protein GGI15_002132 [Coemansia interrupta]|uniref:Enoyl reductase (ER) domain-containing protein n=1 Tax=Coemansia interrupta TaxID=1126814 RepID=A0A9W8HGP4_9FUNG|nr:hypothetical protein GGI15_002132 [Coemansia interrupta]
MTSSNVRIKLVRTIPSGSPALEDFVVEAVDTPSESSLEPNQVLIRSLYFSCDPYFRGRLSGTKDSYVSSFIPGNPLEGRGIGTVEASTSPKFIKGDMVTSAAFKWEKYFISSDGALTKIPSNTAGISPADYLGVLGMPSFTAYVGLVFLCKAQPGETILVSAASGAVGQMVVQLAKARGLRVIGAAGSDDKVDFVKSLGADVVFNYKTCGSLQETVKKAAPQGIDIYFDNVGGELLDVALSSMRFFGRIAACGMISQYNATPETAYHIKNLGNVVTKKVTIYGYIISDYFAKPVYKEFIDEVSSKFKKGDIQYRLDEVFGIENAPQALLDLFEGKNFGKRVIKIADIA